MSDDNTILEFNGKTIATGTTANFILIGVIFVWSLLWFTAGVVVGVTS